MSSDWVPLPEPGPPSTNTVLNFVIIEYYLIMLKMWDIKWNKIF